MRLGQPGHFRLILCSTLCCELNNDNYNHITHCKGGCNEVICSADAYDGALLEIHVTKCVVFNDCRDVM